MLEKVHKFANATSRPSKYNTRKHTRKQISGIVQTKSEPKCGNHENALVAQYQRDASTIAQQADTRTCAQPTQQKWNDFYPKYFFMQGVAMI